MERKLGLEDDDDRLLTEARVAIIRALLACAVGVKLMTRIAREGWQFGEVDGAAKAAIDFDRARLRQLLGADAFAPADSL